MLGTYVIRALTCSVSVPSRFWELSDPISSLQEPGKDPGLRCPGEGLGGPGGYLGQHRNGWKTPGGELRGRNTTGLHLPPSSGNMFSSRQQTAKDPRGDFGTPGPLPQTCPGDLKMACAEGTRWHLEKGKGER